METFDAAQLQQVVNQVLEERRAIERLGEEARSRVRQIKVDEVLTAVPGTPERIDEAKWAALSEDEKAGVQDRIIWLYESLRAAANRDGPADSKHIMSDAFASSGGIIAWMVLAIVLTAGLLGLIVWRWAPATNTDFAPHVQAASAAFARLDTARVRAMTASREQGQAVAKLTAIVATDTAARRAAEQDSASKSREAVALHDSLLVAQARAESLSAQASVYLRAGGATEDMVLLMVVLLGALGGALHLIGSLVKYVGNRQLKRSWLPYYLSLPFVGAGLAPIIYMLLRVGILSPSGPVGEGTKTSDLNLVAIYAFAAMCGIFAKTAMEKLSEIFATVFRIADKGTKDPIGPEKPPGVTPSVVGKTK